MVWDYAEANVFSGAWRLNWMAQVEWVARVVQRLSAGGVPGQAFQADAAFMAYWARDGRYSLRRLYRLTLPTTTTSATPTCRTFFYVWLRRTLNRCFPDLFATLAVPKAEELVATPYRHGSKERRRVLLPQRHDTSDAASSCRISTEYAPHRLLRLQAVREGE